ncbi:ATP-binding protein [Streptomyces sp. NPDC003300]|uniref:ATP-binding protein n=1 Tax=unclassified Streptomyces TaxID=2593676 RepID=UPI0033BE535B
MVSSTRLGAVLTAVGLSRGFIRQTLTAWQLTDQIDSAELIVSELVTNAVKETRVPHSSPMWERVTTHPVIGVQLRLVDTSLYVEVWDQGDGSPQIPEQSLDAEGGRGLFLVESLSKQWDIYRPAVGGKVVWAELLLDKPVNPSLLVEALPLRDPGTHGPVAGEALELVDMALMQRVLDGLRLAVRRDMEAVTV